MALRLALAFFGCHRETASVTATFACGFAIIHPMAKHSLIAFLDL
jgi:hypothetical protein